MVLAKLLLFMVVIAVVYMSYPMVSYYIHKGNSNSLPCLSDYFVGREEEVNDIVQLLDYKSSDLQIINICGSPGFGKSTLAIHVGHRMLEKGVTVHYVDLNDCPREGIELFIAEKIFESSSNHYKTVTFDKFIQWARDRYFSNLIILDNCDGALHNQKEDLQNVIKRVVKNSAIKFLMTSREATLHVGGFEQYKLHELSTKSACHLLQLKLPRGVNIATHEKEELAKLTGNVPLAIQIIGSLLRLPDLASPQSVITELKKDPILTLSPKQLPKDHQINISFSLSYNYLSVEEQRVGQLLSNFPGSFTFEACLGILGNEFETEAINTLVQRSLLDITASKRYQFHSLIKEYFLEKQKKMGDQTVTKFKHNFQVYFFDLLRNASLLYRSPQYKDSLTTLDSERHNLLQIFEDLKTNNVKYYDPKDVLAILTGVIDNGLLSTRFSDEDLLLLIQDSIVYFNTRLDVTLNQMPIDSYLLLIFHYIDFQDKVNSSEGAIKIFNQYKDVIEVVKYGSKIYSKILFKVSSLYSNLGQHKEAIRFHAKAIEHLTKKVYEDQDCSYFELGMYHMHAEEYEQALHFLTLSLETENPATLIRMKILLHLHTIYNKVKYQQRSEILERIAMLVPEVTQLPHFELFHDIEVLNSIILLLYDTNSNETSMLVECMVGVLMTAAEDNVTIDVQHFEKFVDTIYQSGNYTEAAKLGTFFQNSNSKHDTISSLKLSTLIAKAKFHSGNYSQGYTDMETVLDSIMELPLSDYNELFKEYWTCCFYLIPHLRYVHMCFGRPVFQHFYTILPMFQHFYTILPMFQHFYTILKRSIYLTFVQPLDVFPTSNDVHRNQDISYYPEITHTRLSPSTEMNTADDFFKKALSQTYENNVLPSIEVGFSNFVLTFQHILRSLWYVLSYPSLRFCINVASILIRMNLFIMIGATIYTLRIMIMIIIVVDIKHLQTTHSIKLRKPFFFLMQLLKRLYCSLLLSSNMTLFVLIILFWKCIELIIFLENLENQFYKNHFKMNFYIFRYINEKSIAYKRDFSLLLFLYSILIFSLSVVVVHICLCLWL